MVDLPEVSLGHDLPSMLPNAIALDRAFEQPTDSSETGIVLGWPFGDDASIWRDWRRDWDRQ